MLPSELLEQGWCQNRLRDDNGNVCLVGAVNVLQSPSLRCEFYRAAAQLVDVSVFKITDWNNDPARTKAEVVAVAKLVEIKLGLREVETVADVVEPDLVYA